VYVGLSTTGHFVERSGIASFWFHQAMMLDNDVVCFWWQSMPGEVARGLYCQPLKPPWVDGESWGLKGLCTIICSW